MQLCDLSDKELVEYARLVKAGIKRQLTYQTHQMDLKFAYHIVRLLNEIEMILIEGDLDLERNNEQLKSIRRGEWTLAQIKEYFFSKEKDLEKLYIESKLPHSPDEPRIKKLLLNCLEEYFGTLENCIVEPDKAVEYFL